MTELPQYQDDNDLGGDREPRPSTSRRVYVWWIAGIGLVVVMLVLHVSGVFGSGSH